MRGRVHERGLTKRARRLRAGSTSAEDRLWDELRGGKLGGWKWRRQEPRGRFVVDFYCPSAKLVLEVDGGVHDHFGNPERDAARDRELEALGYRVLRLGNDAVFDYLNDTLATILHWCDQPLTPAPLPVNVERGAETIAGGRR